MKKKVFFILTGLVFTIGSMFPNVMETQKVAPLEVCGTVHCGDGGFHFCGGFDSVQELSDWLDEMIAIQC
ncbi:MAG: hypothetical protein LBE91_19230 [Tannerella sp.]|jgi:hypothetical protein|nr:hypothetical protein [Tannerella sp.]